MKITSLRSSFIKSAGLLFSGSLVAQAIGFVATLFLTAFYSPEEFGAVTVFQSIIAVCVVFSGLRFEVAIVAEDDEEKAKDLTRLSMLLNLSFGAVFSLIAVVFHRQICTLFGLEEAPWLYVVSPVFAITGCIEALVHWRNRQKKYQRISINRMISAGSATSYKFLHIVVELIKGNGLIIGHIIGQVLGFIHIGRNSSIQWFDTTVDRLKSVFKEYQQFPKISAPAALVNTLALHMPAFMITAFAGESNTGFYGISQKLTYIPLSLLAMAVSQVFYERIARLRTDQEATAEISHSLFNFLVLLGVIPVIAVAVWGDVIFPFILGDKWTTSGQMAQVLILFYFTMFLTSPFSSSFVVYDKLKQQLIYNISFIIVTGGTLYFTFVNGWDTLDAIAAFAIAGGVMRLFILNYFFKLLGKSLLLKTLLLFGILIPLVLALQYIRSQIG
ncbi:oligosaccharide flippase family protein [bacterium]|nr:oligosaccharide flippase family protein [bacterium]